MVLVGGKSRSFIEQNVHCELATVEKTRVAEDTSKVIFELISR